MNDTFQPRHESSAPGAALARARIAQNLSVIEVARHLKLTPAQVEAIEAGDYERLPGRVFVRGFLKNYAKLVRIEPGPILRQIDSDIPKPMPVAEMRLAREVPLPVYKRSRWPLFAGIAFLIVAALAVYEFGFNEEHDRANGGRDGTSAATADTATAAAPGASPALAVPTPTAPMPSSAVAAAPAVALPPLASTTNLPTEPRGELVNSQAMQTAQARAPGPGERQLLFRFDEDSWVEIRDRDNKVIFSKLNRAGSDERVSGMPPLKLIVGNAKNVHLTYNSKAVDLTPHIGVTVARVTIE